MNSWLTAGAAALLIATSLVQLALGVDILVLILSLACLGLGFAPLCYLGRDIYTVLTAPSCFRYTGGVFFAKTAYGQPLDSLLKAPVESYALCTIMLAMVVAATLLARRLDRGRSIFVAPQSSEHGRQVGLVAFGIGIAAGTLAGMLVKRDTAEANTGGAYVIANALMTLVYLGYAAEIIYTVGRSQGRQLLSSRLAGMLALSIALAIFLNIRSLAVNSVLCVFLSGFLLNAIRVKHLALGCAFAFVFATYITPVALELRNLKEGQTAAGFASEAVEMIARTITDPAFIGELQERERFRSQYATVVLQYDYFGDGSNILNRLAFVGLVDSVYDQTRVLNPIGTRALTEQVIPRIAPSFLVEKEARNYGYGDWLSWEFALVEFGRISFLSFTLPVEGIALFGPIVGVTIWTFMFVFLILIVLGRVSSLKIASATSIFVFSAIQWELIEGASEVYISMVLRVIPLCTIPAILLYRLWGMKNPLGVGASGRTRDIGYKRSGAATQRAGNLVGSRPTG